jgi:hypothetical protein
MILFLRNSARPSLQLTCGSRELWPSPSVLYDEDEGVAEALRRDADLDASPESGITLEQLDERIRR